jgi:hypothetical protein
VAGEAPKGKKGNLTAHVECSPDGRSAPPTLASWRLGTRVISDCHFRKTGTEYESKPGMKWLSCTEK